MDILKFIEEFILAIKDVNPIIIILAILLILAVAWAIIANRKSKAELQNGLVEVERAKAKIIADTQERQQITNLLRIQQTQLAAQYAQMIEQSTKTITVIENTKDRLDNLEKGQVEIKNNQTIIIEKIEEYQAATTAHIDLLTKSIDGFIKKFTELIDKFEGYSDDTLRQARVSNERYGLLAGQINTVVGEVRTAANAIPTNSNNIGNNILDAQSEGFSSIEQKLDTIIQQTALRNSS